MKTVKILSILFVSVLIFSAVTASAAANGYYCGDADGDDEVSIIDVTVIQRWLVGIPVASFVEKAADVDDNELDITDATWIQRYLAGISNPYHIGEYIVENTTPTLDEYELPFIPN